MPTEPMFYAVVIPAIILIGLAKGGFLSGLASIGVPIMALVMSPIQAAAILLPILVAMDIVGVVAYRRNFDVPSVRILVPATAVGIFVGWLTAAYTSEAAVRLIVGLIALAFVLDYWLRTSRQFAPRHQSDLIGRLCGAVGGFTSFVSHAGAPPIQIYLVPKQMENLRYAGTMAITFAAINAMKLPPYFALGQFSSDNLTTSLVLMPLAPLSMFAGIWLVQRIPQGPFYKIITGCILVIAIKLIYDGGSQLFSL